MGPVIVIFLDPIIQYQSCLPDGQELPFVQAIIPQNTVETFVVPILPRLFWFDELGIDTIFHSVVSEPHRQ